MSNKGWIGVDLDGTLAHYDGWKGIDYIGEPIAPMVERVKRWILERKNVRILTARVAPNDDGRDIELTRIRIQQWCVDHIGACLSVTCQKDMWMTELWEDCCVQVEPNTGYTLLQRIANLEDQLYGNPND